MELNDFVEIVGGEPLTKQQQEILRQIVDVTPTGRTRVCVVGDRFNQARAIGNLIHEDFNRLEERVLADPLTVERLERQLEKTIIFGTRYSQCWFDEYAGMQIKDLPHREVFKMAEPADHPTRKREPKGPRGKWGKLK